MSTARFYRPEAIHLDQARARLRDLEVQSALADLFDENAISEREVRDLWTALHPAPDVTDPKLLVAAQARVQRLQAATETLAGAFTTRMAEFFNEATAA